MTVGVDIRAPLGSEADSLLNHESKGIERDHLHPLCPGRLFGRVDRHRV